MTWRLTVLLTCMGLATSRIGLVAHELLGHGGVALALGAAIIRFKLFWFGGGWITYRLHDAGHAAELAVTLGGMAIEIVIGSILWFAVRGDAFGARLVRATGGAVMVHAGWYFSTGTWHGYGDGAMIYRELGDWRYPVAIAVGALTVAMTYVGARWVAGAIAASATKLGVAVAVVAAFAINLGLDRGELAVRTDRAYAGAMMHENDRVVASELRRIERQRPAMDDAERAAVVQRLEDENRTFPFRWVLAAGVVLAFLLGAWRSPRRARVPIPDRLILRAGAVALGSLAIVIALSALL